MSSSLKTTLGKLGKGSTGHIVQVGNSSSSSELIARLLNMGILEGSEFTVVHEAPFGGDPLAVRVRGALIALRRNEADAIQVMINE